MKTRSLRHWSFGVALALLPLLSGCLERSARSLEATSNTEMTTADTMEDATGAMEGTASEIESPTRAALSSASVKPVSAEKPLPASVNLNGAVQEAVRLANSGVDDKVFLAFITNSPSTFNLGSEEIIYLNDVGVPGSVVTAMIQRDQDLKSPLEGEATAVAMAPASES